MTWMGMTGGETGGKTSKSVPHFGCLMGSGIVYKE